MVKARVEVYVGSYITHGDVQGEQLVLVIVYDICIQPHPQVIIVIHIKY